MKKLLLLASALLIMLSGCSKNEFVDDNGSIRNDGKVRFAATTNRVISRAADNNPITGTKDLQDNVKKFHVLGYVGSETTPLVNSEVNWTGASWEYANEPYWPAEKMNFFAYANWGTALTVSSTGITSSVTIGQDNMNANGQKDLLVAALKDEVKDVRTTLTFKHALTQIVFKAGNLNSTNLQVRIGGVRIVNVSETGTMAVTAETTGAKVAWTDNTTTQETKYAVQGLQVTDNTFAAAAASAAFDVTAVDPTTPYSDYEQVQTATAGDNALMLVPQTFTAWDPNNSQEKPATTKKAYIELLAIINHPNYVSDASNAGESAYYYCGTPKVGVDGASDIYGKIYIPIESKADDMNEWVAGKRISYIITFGDSGSGSGGGGYDSDNQPVLVPIKFRATVEDWVDVDVPLLTASFNASSQNITAAFIDGFTNQLLNDIAAAKDRVKTYRANIKVSGVLKEASKISFSDAQNSKIATASTVTYNFTEITNWNSAAITMTVPTGWQASSYKNAETTAISEVDAGSDISVEGTNANKIVLTKIVDNIP